MWTKPHTVLKPEGCIAETVRPRAVHFLVHRTDELVVLGCPLRLDLVSDHHLTHPITLCQTGSGDLVDRQSPDGRPIHLACDVLLLKASGASTADGAAPGSWVSARQ
jgi:hypothetical protein